MLPILSAITGSVAKTPLNLISLLLLKSLCPIIMQRPPTNVFALECRLTASRCVVGSHGAANQPSNITRRIRFKRPDPAAAASTGSTHATSAAKRNPSRPRLGGGDDTRVEPFVKSLAKLVLQQEEVLQAHSRACGYILHLGRTPEHSVVEQLIAGSKAWKQAVETHPSQIRKPLRALLYKLIMSSLMSKVADLTKESGEQSAKLCLNESHAFYEMAWQESPRIWM